MESAELLFYILSLHDALPIWLSNSASSVRPPPVPARTLIWPPGALTSVPVVTCNNGVMAPLALLNSITPLLRKEVHTSEPQPPDHAISLSRQEPIAWFWNTPP